jgi:MFS superfamily sulfate permease-like transporter
MIRRFLPFLKWYEGYNYQKFRFDLIAGSTVALVLIPQSMAYAQLAGLPAYYGLYAAFLPPLVASLFGSSNHLATGPVAVISLITSVSLEPLAIAGSESFIAYAILLALMVGIFKFFLGVMKLGIIVNLLSYPVVIGFTNAAAIIIVTSQLSKIFGVYVDGAERHYETVYEVVKTAFYYTHLPTLGIAIFAFITIFLLRQVNSRIPTVVVAVILTILISTIFNFERTYHTDLSTIQSSMVSNTIREYNYTIDEIASAAQLDYEFKRASDQWRDEVDQTAAAGHLRVDCYKCHTYKEFGSLGIKIDQNGAIKAEELVRLIHDPNLHERNLKILRDKAPRLREIIRRYHLVTSDTNDGTKLFYLHDQVPADGTVSGTIWRIMVKNDRIDESSVFLSVGGDVVGTIPAGLPKFTIPVIDFSIVGQLISAMIIISFLGLMESISIARAMGAKTGQRLDPNQELIGQGMANIVGSFAQSYSVSGSFSRSAVNLQAGAVTGLSNVLSSLIVGITLLLFTPLLYNLPQSVLATIIIIAVMGLISIKPFVHAFSIHKYEGFIAVITFVSTLIFAPRLDIGILIGILLSLGHWTYRRIEPNLVLLSRYKQDKTFRNIARWGLSECQHICLIRLEGSLTFTNSHYFEEKIIEQTKLKPELKYIIIVGNAINEVDASGEEVLASLIPRLLKAKYQICFTGLTGSIRDTLKRTGLYNKIGADNIFSSVALAVDTVYSKAHENSEETDCPLHESSREDKD